MNIRFGPYSLEVESDSGRRQVGGPSDWHWEDFVFYRVVIDDGEVEWPPLEISVFPPEALGRDYWEVCLSPTTPNWNPSVEGKANTLQDALIDFWKGIQKHAVLKDRVRNASQLVENG